MKKIFLLSATCASLGLVGCNSATNTSTDVADASTNPTAPMVVAASPEASTTTATNAHSSAAPKSKEAVAADDAAAKAAGADPSITYAAKETYPHASSGASPTALIGGGPSQSGGEPIAPSASVIEGRLTEWKLSAAEIQGDIESGKAIVRTKEIGANAPTGRSDDEALHTLINNRLLADTETVRVATKMEVTNGEVAVHGSAASADQIARVMAIILDTNGVTKITSDMKIDPTQPGSPREDASRIPSAAKTPSDEKAPVTGPSGPTKPTADDHINGIDKANGAEPNSPR